MYDVEAALAPGSPILHEDWAEYGASEDVVREGNDCSRSTIVKGDVDKGMAALAVHRSLLFVINLARVACSTNTGVQSTTPRARRLF